MSKNKTHSTHLQNPGLQGLHSEAVRTCEDGQRRFIVENDVLRQQVHDYRVENEMLVQQIENKELLRRRHQQAEVDLASVMFFLFRLFFQFIVFFRACKFQWFIVWQRSIDGIPVVPSLEFHDYYHSLNQDFPWACSSGENNSIPTKRCCESRKTDLLQHRIATGLFVATERATRSFVATEDKGFVCCNRGHGHRINTNKLI